MVAITKLYILAPLIYIKQCSSLIAVFVLYNYSHFFLFKRRVIILCTCEVLYPSLYHIVTEIKKVQGHPQMTFILCYEYCC